MQSYYILAAGVAPILGDAASFCVQQRWQVVNDNQLTPTSILAVLEWREGTPVAAVKMIEFSELFLLAQSLERGRGGRGQRHLLSSRYKKRPTVQQPLGS